MDLSHTFTDARNEILRIIDCLTRSESHQTFESFLLTEEFAYDCLRPERRTTGNAATECYHALSQLNDRAWSAFLALALPYFQGDNLGKFHEIVEQSPFKGNVFIPFIESRSGDREFDFSHLKHILNEKIRGDSMGVVLYEKGVAILDSPQGKIIAHQILASG